MEYNYVISARRVSRNKEFEAEPGKPRFLKAPRDRLPDPSDEIPAARWVDEVRDAADGSKDTRIGERGDVLIFVHGYNNDMRSVTNRQNFLTDDLAAEGFKGIVVSFDWPSDNSTLNYLEDRSDAAQTAMSLVSHGVIQLAKGQEEGCQTNIHLLGHSTGAYVICEAFIQAEKKKRLFQSHWRVSQIALISGDIASTSLAADDQWTAPMFKRCVRVTNYYNGYDHVLAVSNAKRFGSSPRAGRVGGPADRHPKVVDLDCSEYFTTLDPDQSRFEGTFAHSWHIGNRVFARDLAMTLTSGIDRNVIPTRKGRSDGTFVLQDASRPRFEASWTNERGVG